MMCVPSIGRVRFCRSRIVGAVGEVTGWRSPEYDVGRTRWIGVCCAVWVQRAILLAVFRVGRAYSLKRPMKVDLRRNGRS